MSEHHLRNNPYKVAIAAMVGTAIEFYDYYIYAAAAVLVFNTQFFDKSDPPSRHYSIALDAGTGLFRPPHRLGAVRPLRRQNRAQKNPGRLTADHGAVHRRHRPLAQL